MAKSKSSKETSVLIMDAEGIRRALRRIAHEILEQNRDISEVVLVGVPSRGVTLSQRLAHLIGQIEDRQPELGVIDVSMHRDDLQLRAALPNVVESTLPPEIEKRTLILVDDVLYTGRTCRAALEAILSFGRPARVQLAVLIDRGHRELPIRPDYVGKNLPTSKTERVLVRLDDLDGEPDGVRIEKP